MTERRIRAIRAPRSVRAVGVLLVLALLVAGCSNAKTNFQFEWPLFFSSIFQPDHQILGGLYLTVVIAVAAQIIGVILGVFAALGKMSRIRPIRWLASTYVWIFRGTPLIVQLVFFYLRPWGGQAVRLAGLGVRPDNDRREPSRPGSLPSA